MERKMQNNAHISKSEEATSKKKKYIYIYIYILKLNDVSDYPSSFLLQ
jgi:hypothetical protein